MAANIQRKIAATEKLNNENVSKKGIRRRRWRSVHRKRRNGGNGNGGEIGWPISMAKISIKTVARGINSVCGNARQTGGGSGAGSSKRAASRQHIAPR
jgi:hypothetical protein